MTDMIESFGRRLRIGLGRGQRGLSGTEQSEEPSVGGQEVDFVAYGEDCVLSGLLRMSADRLTDMLNEHDEYVLVDVLLERLVDGVGIEVKEVMVLRDDLLLVHATGPRGNVARRHRTRTYPVALQIGPYHIRGHLHASAGRDPIVQLRRRKTMVPLTDASIDYQSGTARHSRVVGTVVVNREQIDWIVPAEEDRSELAGLPDLPPQVEQGPLLKDFTGALFDS